MNTITITHPDYGMALSEKLKALGAERYGHSVAILSVHMDPRPKAKWADIRVTYHSWPIGAYHTVRFWKHGPISLMDCDHGTISGQDTMRLFGAGADCPACTGLVQSVRAHRGLRECQWYFPGSTSLGPILRMFDAANDGKRLQDRVRRDTERRDAVMAVPVSGTLEARIKVAIDRGIRVAARETDLAGWSLNVKVGTGFMAAARCYKRGWGQGEKRVDLTVPMSWARTFRECRGYMGVHLVGAVLSTSPDGLRREAIAFKVQSPVDRSAWWYATFTRASVDETWVLDKWRRNGAVGAERARGGK